MANYVSCLIHRAMGRGDAILPVEDAVAIDPPNGDRTRRQYVCLKCAESLSASWRIRTRAPRVDTAQRGRMRSAAARNAIFPLLEVVARLLHVDAADLLVRRKRRQHVAFARQVVMYLCREDKQWTWELIGAAFGRHHSTAIHAHKLVRRRLKEHPDFALTLRQIRAEWTHQNQAAAA